MSTYYGYAEREAEDNINWSTVGNDITKMLKEEVERRETLKTDIDKATRDYGETLANAPTGTHKGANDFITRFSDDATQAMLMQDRLLKSGQLKVKDYLLQRANLKDDTKNIFGVAKKFQAEFKRKAERMTKDESAKLEQTLFKMTEGFANFNNSGAYINPTNYSVSLAKKERVQDKDGNYVYQMSKKPQDFFTVSELNTFVSVDLDRFDTEGAMDKIAKAAGARDQQIFYYDKATQTYQTVKISDVTGELFKNLPAAQQKLVDNYKKAEEDAIDSIISNSYNAASVLTDYVGKGYDFTFDPSEAAKDDKMILLEKDPSGSGIPKVILSDPQKDEIKKSLSAGIKFRLDQKYEQSGVQKRDKSAALLAFQQGQESAQDQATTILTDWVTAAMGASNEATSKASYNNIITLYNEMNQGKDKKQIQRIDKVGDQSIQIVYSDGSTLTPIPLNDKNAYIRAIKGLFPEQFNIPGFNDDEIQAKGNKKWRAGKGGENFNAFGVSVGFEYTPPEASGVVTATDPETYKETIAADDYGKINDDSLFGNEKNAELGQQLAEIGQKQIQVINEKLRKAGLKQISTKVQSDGSGNLSIINPENNAQIKMDFYDSRFISEAQEKLMANILNYQNGILPEENLEGAYKDFLKKYLEAATESYTFNKTENGKGTKGITLGGVKYSYNDMMNPDDTTALEALINMAKKLKQKRFNTQTTTTTQSTTGGGAGKTDPFGNPIK